MSINSNTFSIKSHEESYRFEPSDCTFYGEDPNFPHLFILNTYAIKYKVGKVYTVSIDSSLRDIHGYKLNAPYTFSFTPEPKFRLVDVYPSAIAVEPENFNKIVVSFNSKITQNTLSKFLMTPNIAGAWSIISEPYSENDSMSATFRINNELQYDTEYKISLSADAADAAGAVIDKSYLYTFKTPAFFPKLDSYSSTIGPNGFYVPQNIRFRFNGFIDTASVRSSISINPQVDFNLNFSGNYSSSNFNSVTIDMNTLQLTRNTVYDITFNKTIRTTTGTYMKKAYTFAIATGQ